MIKFPSNIEQLQESGRIIFETVAGSHAYGTATPNSDVDIRGFFAESKAAHLQLNPPPTQISDAKNDVTYYGLKRAFELLMTANPNMIELLWMPEDCIRVNTSVMELIIHNRDVFISGKCFHTHSGYAYAQIKKAKGQNKKVHNPQPEQRPVKEDFCWVVSAFEIDQLTDSWLPSRPVPVKKAGIDLSQFHASSLEHCENMYRIYKYGEEAKGVFRGDDMLVVESIPPENEYEKFHGLLIYNKVAYEKAVKEWHSYWDWMKNRNETRWVDQEKGKLNYDQKNMMHCMRLLKSGESILRTGEPIVRFEGEELDYLMAIRAGEIEYDTLMVEVEKRMAEMEELYKSGSVVPHKIDMKKVQRLFMDVLAEVEEEGTNEEDI